MTQKGYSLLPAQRQFLHVDLPEVDLDVCTYQGGFGSGKSFIGSFLGHELCQKYPGIRGLVGALTWPMVRDSTLESYFEHFDVLGFVEGEDYTWNSSKKILFYPNGSKILFRHLEEPRKLKSLNLGFAHLEEMSELPESTFLMVLSRMRQQGIPRKRVFGTTNPQANKGWIWKYFVESNRGPQIQEVKGQRTVIHYRRIIAPSTENTNLDPAYLLNMATQYDPEYYRINVLGEDGDYTAGLVVKDWSDLNEVETPFRPELKVHITCDFNYDPMCWVLMHRFNGEYHGFDELVEEHTTVTDHIDRFAAKYPPDKVESIEINGDASGNQHRAEGLKHNETCYKQMLNRLSALGYRKVRLNVRDANPAILDRVAAYNAAVCNKEGVRRVFLNPKTCKWTIHNMKNLMYKEGRSEIKTPLDSDIKRDPKSKFLGHPFDAVSYIVEKYDPVVLKIKNPNYGDVVAPDLNFGI